MKRLFGIVCLVLACLVGMMGCQSGGEPQDNDLLTIISNTEKWEYTEKSLLKRSGYKEAPEMKERFFSSPDAKVVKWGKAVEFSETKFDIYYAFEDEESTLYFLGARAIDEERSEKTIDAFFEIINIFTEGKAPGYIMSKAWVDSEEIADIGEVDKDKVKAMLSSDDNHIVSLNSYIGSGFYDIYMRITPQIIEIYLCLGKPS